MIIEELVLHDFGIYGGRHSIDLTPISPERPIILIGARNGRGKTTILDAINLVLFGNRARLSNRGGKSWEEFLRESIHRKASGGASVAMRFTVADDFEIRTYEISRSWVLSGKSVKEFFDVSVNGRPDTLLAEDWNEHIEGLLPLEVASLNFFDGEKIDELTDPNRSRDVIGAAIRGLLGLGVMERLEADLKVYLRRKQDSAIADDASTELLDLEAELRTLIERRTEVRHESGQAKVAVDRSEEVLRRLKRQAAELGADKWEKRTELDAERIELSESKAVLEQRLQNLVAGSAPLGLVTDLLERTHSRMLLDEEIEMARRLSGLLEDRDARVINLLNGAASEAADQVLAADRALWKEKGEKQIIHTSQEGLHALVFAALTEANDRTEVEEILSEIDTLEARLTNVDRALLAVPSEGQLAPVLTEIAVSKAQVESLSAQFGSLMDEIAHLDSTIERLDHRVARIREVEADRQKEALEERRAREYAKRALETVGLVSKMTVTRNLAQIEEAILDRFRSLIGKQDLITGVRIHRDTLELTVETSDGVDLSVDRMSAGERQLLATATLWALSTVAGRSIPLVIDTPLGRLDAVHRQQLASNYFPTAAHQVIILSTDSEFDEALRNRIEPSISREYLIQFRESEESSEIIPGYFVGASHGS